jgi:predicted NBD/HSP70 family sugar kinase
MEDFVFFHVGTGVGMGAVLKGQLYRGSRGAAGEVGYLPLAVADPHDPRNRRRGALESAIGAAGVVAAARASGMRGKGLSAARVFEEARRGDNRASRVVEGIGAGIGLAIAAVIPVLDPELVIMGGAIGRNVDLLLPAIDRELAALSPFRPPIEASGLGEDAELTGAVAFALEEARQRLFARGDGRRRVGA